MFFFSYWSAAVTAAATSSEVECTVPLTATRTQCPSGTSATNRTILAPACNVEAKRKDGCAAINVSGCGGREEEGVEGSCHTAHRHTYLVVVTDVELAEAGDHAGCRVEHR